MELKEYANVERISFEKKLTDHFIKHLVYKVFSFTCEAWNEDSTRLKRAGWGPIEYYLVFLYALFSYSSTFTLRLRDPLMDEARDIEKELSKRDIKGLEEVKQTVKDGLTDLWSKQEDEIPWPEYLVSSLLSVRHYTIADYIMAEAKEQGEDPEELLEALSQSKEVQEHADEEVSVSLGHFYRPLGMENDYKEYKEDEFNRMYEQLLEQKEGFFF
jgi:hypothetical protein